MAAEDDAAQAAGDAAFDRAQDSAWPPTEGDYQAIGSVAGGAAGAVLGGPVGAAVGAAVGSAVGSAVFGLGEAIAGGLDPNRGAGDAPMLSRFIWQTVAPSPQKAASELAALCGTTQQDELAEFRARGVALQSDGTPADMSAWRMALQRGGAPAARPLVTAFQRQLFAAVSARVAECQTLAAAHRVPQLKSAKDYHRPVKRDGVGLGTVAIGGGLLWLLASLL